MVIAETVNRKGRLIVDDEMAKVMTVQVRSVNRAGDHCWRGVWSSECLDDGDIVDGVEFMEGYCWCEPKLAFGLQP